MQTERIKVLLIDDDQGDFEMTRAMMSQIDTAEMTLDWVSTFEEGVDALEEGAHDVYLIDYFLEDRTGMDLLDEARKRAIKAPLIMLTGRGNRKVDMQAMKAGASDYLVKGRIDPELLERSIRFALERARVERALRESEERHRGMFDHLPIGLYRSSPDGEFMDANPALVRILGYPDRNTLREAYSRNLYVNPDERERFKKLLKTYGVARGFETWVERFDGKMILVRNTARVHREQDRTIAYVEGSVEDVTGSHRSRGIERSEARFRTVFDDAGIGIVTADHDGRVMEANPAFHRIFGYPPDEMQGESLVEMAVDEERGELHGRFESLREGETPKEFGEHRFLARDGTVLWARAKLSMITDGDGEPDHVVVLFEDVSEATAPA